MVSPGYTYMFKTACVYVCVRTHMCVCNNKRKRGFKFESKQGTYWKNWREENKGGYYCSLILK